MLFNANVSFFFYLFLNRIFNDRLIMFFDEKDPASHQDDSGTESMTKKSDEKSAKKGGAPGNLTVPKEGPAKSATGKETRAGTDEQQKSRLIKFVIASFFRWR